MTERSDRRWFLSTLGRAALCSAATPYVVHFWRDRAGAQSAVPSRLRADEGRVFDLSIASGDPSEAGVVLWTHLKPEAAVSRERLWFQVATDAAFSGLLVEGEIDTSLLAADDYTVRVDLDGALAPGQRYYYRFVYGDTSSRVGRCRTLPSRGPRSLKLGVVTCQDYTNGYYGAFHHIASDASIDFVVHLGDSIYESVGDPRFQPLPFADRWIFLPSGATLALGLEDYRHLYRTYRSDPDLQRALEQHTWIFSHDDHETANDCYWDYDRDTLGAPDHPFAADALALKRLKLDSQRAWLEYMPVRVDVNPHATHPHDYVKTYRDFKFGDLLRLSMLDTRSYRTAHPCGEGDFLERYLPLGCRAYRSPEQSMLGPAQAAWLVDRLGARDTLFNVIGNQTYFGRLALAGKVPINTDAWDGYEAERRWLTREIRRRGVSNLVVLTGDLHSYIASHIKVDYDNLNGLDAANTVGVEFMTPSITSSGLFDGLSEQARSDPALADGLSEAAVRLNNPHIKYFNSSKHGYSTVTFSRDACEWTAYSVDKNVRAPAPLRQVVARFRKYTWWPYLIEQSLSEA